MFHVHTQVAMTHFVSTNFRNSVLLKKFMKLSASRFTACTLPLTITALTLYTLELTSDALHDL